MQNEKASWLTQLPIAHRGFHARERGIWENSRSAVLAALERGFAIEVDLQPSKDQQAMVFHDYELDRMTGHSGDIRTYNAQDLLSVSLMDGADTVWRFADLLDTVKGRVPLVAEMKGRSGCDTGFVASVGDALRTYRGPVAVMSFSHWLVEEAKETLPGRLVGLTAEGDEQNYGVHRDFCRRVDPDFLSYRHTDLDCRFVREFRKTGKPVICWTVRSEDQARQAYRLADQITFEGFVPAGHPTVKVQV